jgi:hypothetical protein
MNYKIAGLVRGKNMKISQAVGLVVSGTLILQLAGMAISAYVHDRDIAKNQKIEQQKTPAEIDRSHRELAKDYAFLHDNPTLEEPTYQKLNQAAKKPKHP